MSATVTHIAPKTIEYRDHVITLVHRPQTNDWKYRVEHTRTIVVSHIAPRYDTAVKSAKRDIDILLGQP